MGKAASGKAAPVPAGVKLREARPVKSGPVLDFARERGFTDVHVLPDVPFFGIKGAEVPPVYAARRPDGSPVVLLWDPMGAWRVLPAPHPLYVAPGAPLDVLADRTWYQINPATPRPDTLFGLPKQGTAGAQPVLPPAMGRWSFRPHHPRTPTYPPTRAEQARLREEEKARQAAQRAADKAARAKAREEAQAAKAAERAAKAAARAAKAAAKATRKAVTKAAR